MSISREHVLHVARLARLELDEAEVEAMTRDLAAILDYVERMRTADAGAAAPPPAEPGTPLREDRVVGGLPPGVALESAPSVEEGMFQVPPAFEDRP
jgi:aspartyl-tRNA(Asn)/glutamyl-tRNA(Gln) amidotransferase subunit C